MNTRNAIMIAGVAGSAALAIFGDRTPGRAAVEPAARVEAARPVDRDAELGAAVPPSADRSADKGQARAPTMILALRPRADLLGRASRDLFASQTFDPPPPPPPPVAKQAASAPPSPPPMPFTYLGKKLEDARWEVYLAIGDHTYFVREGSVVERDYAVNAIKPPVLTMTYLPMKQMQTLQIGGAD